MKEIRKYLTSEAFTYIKARYTPWWNTVLVSGQVLIYLFYLLWIACTTTLKIQDCQNVTSLSLLCCYFYWRCSHEWCLSASLIHKFLIRTHLAFSSEYHRFFLNFPHARHMFHSKRFFSRTLVLCGLNSLLNVFLSAIISKSRFQKYLTLFSSEFILFCYLIILLVIFNPFLSWPTGLAQSGSVFCNP